MAMPELKNIVLPATLLFLLLAATVVFYGEGLTEDNFRQIIRVTATSSLAFSAWYFPPHRYTMFFAMDAGDR